MNVLKQLTSIHTFIFDVDGVLTDGTLLVTEHDELLRSMHAKDGFALRWALDKGYKIFIITGGRSQGVKQRLAKLGIEHIYLGIHDKLSLFQDLVANEGLDAERSLYMGDDVPDYSVMKAVKIASCPNDAVPEIKEISHIITEKKGGKGCVREVIETVLRLQDNWFQPDKA